jgi:hypothetical protein
LGEEAEKQISPLRSGRNDGVLLLVLRFGRNDGVLLLVLRFGRMTVV